MVGLSCSLSGHFCFQSLRDNIVHQNKNADGQERRKEALLWKKPWHREFFLFLPGIISHFEALSVLETAKVRWVWHHGVQWVFVCTSVG